MPLRYKKKSENPVIANHLIEEAVAECKNNGGLRKVAAKFCIPQTSLSRVNFKEYMLNGATAGSAEAAHPFRLDEGYQLRLIPKAFLSIRETPCRSACSPTIRQSR
ncbi:hypothetical protein JTB14_028567 [Gonioctena quinquepunctata]|nr:hypothetical protein JTB14_028567 [Gonioctena quinquepunctata]